MTYILSDPVPAAYPFSIQRCGTRRGGRRGSSEGKGTSEVGCYRHATGRNGNVKHREEMNSSPTSLHRISSQRAQSSLGLVAIVPLCKPK